MIPPESIVNGLTGAVDRWKAGAQYWPEARDIYDSVKNSHGPVEAAVNREFGVLGTTSAQASAPQ